jgi:magnesium transporter
MLKAICHEEATGWFDVDDPSVISQLIQHEGAIVWAELDQAGLVQKDVDTIAEEFGLHPLAVEDAISLKQRPKLEAYENHLFAIMHQLDEDDGQFEAKRIACFIGKGWVLTVHEHSERTLGETRARLLKEKRPRDRGPSHIMHTLLDVIVDDYQHKTDALEDEVEQLEERLLEDPQQPVDKQLYSLKQRLARLRRYAVPGERILTAMLGPVSQVPDETGAYFRDIHDHILRIIDQMRNVQDLSDAMIDLRRVEQANALNEVTKRLTGWAAIIAVPTFIASVYGMNFQLIPNEGGIFGFVFAIALMAGSGIGLYSFFKKRGWI